MAKETFQRTKPHVNVGTIGHIDHGKTTLTGAILACQAEKGLAEFKSYADIAKGGTVRDETKTVTIAVAHVEYETENRHYAHIDCPGHADFHQEYDHRRRSDGRCDSGGVGGGRPDASDERARFAGASGRRAGDGGLHEQDRPGRRPELLDLVEIEIRELLDKYEFPGDDIPIVRGSSLPAYEKPGDPEARKCIDELMEAIDSLYSGADSRRGQAVFDGHRRCLFDRRPRHGRDRSYRDEAWSRSARKSKSSA